MAESLQLSSGELATFGPISAWDYYQTFIPICQRIEVQLRELGDWGFAVLEPEFMRLVDVALSCLPRVDRPEERVTVENLGDWYQLPILFEELIPKLHQLPELPFRKLSLKPSSGSSGDSFADLVYSTAETFGVDALKKLDVVALHRTQWLANQSAFNSLPLEKIQELAQAERMEKVKEDAKQAKAQQAETLRKIAEKRKARAELERFRSSGLGSTATEA